jgi:hypothetical protein
MKTYITLFITCFGILSFSVIAAPITDVFAGIDNPALPAPTNLCSRHFRVDARMFANTLLPTIPDLQTNDVPTMAKRFFSQLGVNMDLPGKSVFYNDGMSELFVRATSQDIDTIEEAIQALNRPPPQLHIKARFLEAPKGTLAGLGNFLNSTNSAAGQFTGILTDANMRAILQSLGSHQDVETLAEPEVITTSGRQTQMRATTKVETDVVYDVVVERPTKPLEIGPILDVVPIVLSDGFTINLTLIPSLNERMINSNSVPNTLPDFRVRQVVTTLNLWDGQTAIISGFPEKDYVNGKEVFDKSKSCDKELLVFITATIVDPAGNRIHSDKELSFAKNGVPMQPK